MIKLTDEQYQSLQTIYQPMKRARMEYKPFNATFIGSAGTGKTTSIISLVSMINKDNIEPTILFMSNTHAAVKILRSALLSHGFVESENLSVMTVASALGLKPHEVEENQVFLPDLEAYKFDKYDYVIIDEASQLSEAMTDFIIEKGDEECKAIIFMGDGYQLPPVKESHSHALVTADVNARAALTTVMRYEGTVLTHATAIRDFITREYARIKASKAIVKPAMKKYPLENLYAAADASDDFIIVDDLSEVIDMFTTAVMEDNYHCRFLAYSNKDVDMINGMIHKAMFGAEAEHYCIGATIVALSPVIKDKKAKSPEYLLATEEEAIIVESEVEYVDAAIWDKQLEGEIECKRLFLLPVDKIGHSHKDMPHHQVADYYNKYSAGVISILVPDKIPAGVDNYEAVMAHLLSTAKSKPNNETWGNFWSCKNALESVRLAYATTIYKCQGSTYDAVFIASENIKKSLYSASNELFNRALYTAITRSAIVVLFKEIINE